MIEFASRIPVSMGIIHALTFSSLILNFACVCLHSKTWCFYGFFLIDSCHLFIVMATIEQRHSFALNLTVINCVHE